MSTFNSVCEMQKLNEKTLVGRFVKHQHVFSVIPNVSLINVDISISLCETDACTF